MPLDGEPVTLDSPAPPRPTRGLTAGWLADRGFAPPKDAALDRHYRKALPGGLSVEVILTAAGPRVVVFRGPRWFEVKAVTAAELAELLAVLEE
jgi:hypothetical protein